MLLLCYGFGFLVKVVYLTGQLSYLALCPNTNTVIVHWLTYCLWKQLTGQV